jgi:hypothetical protein
MGWTIYYDYDYYHTFYYRTFLQRCFLYDYGYYYG